jgi:hypothetical protein
MIVPADSVPFVARRFRASMVWMNLRALETGRSYFIKHTSHQVRGVIRSIYHRVDVNSLARVEASRLELNEIGEVSVETHRSLFFDPYTTNRITGAFIVIDPLSNETLGAGMILDVEGKEEIHSHVTEAERAARFGHRGAVVAVTDSEAALLLERELFDRGALVAVVDAAFAEAASAAGMIAIVVGKPLAGSLTPLEASALLPGHEESLLDGEGI